MSAGAIIGAPSMRPGQICKPFGAPAGLEFRLKIQVVLLALLIGMLMTIGTAAYGVQNLMRPDDVVRLAHVRDLLAGQSGFDVTHYRADLLAGSEAVRLSHIADIPLAAMIFVLTPVLGVQSAETALAYAVPLLALFIALALVARLASRFFASRAVLLSCVSLVTAIPVLSQLQPLRIDHYSWQISLALLAANGMACRNPRRGGYIIGFALGLLLAISSEGLPLAAIICGIMALRWIRGRDGRHWFVSTTQALAVTSLITFVAMRGFEDLAQHCDAISSVHLAMFAFSAVGAVLLARANPLSPYTLIAGLAVIGGGALAIYLSAAPQCAGSGFGALKPILRETWLNRSSERLPIWAQGTKWETSFLDMVQAIMLPALGLVACAMLAMRARGDLRLWWVDYALMLAGTGLASLVAPPTSGVTCALAAVPLGWLLAKILARARRTWPRRRLNALHWS